MVYLKKGLVWSTLIHALLGIALIAIIAGILFPIKDYVNEKFFDEEGAFSFSPKDRFIPYGSRLSSEEKIVDDSMKALQCAIDRTASSQTDWSICPSGFTEVTQDPYQNKKCCQVTEFFAAAGSGGVSSQSSSYRWATDCSELATSGIGRTSTSAEAGNSLCKKDCTQGDIRYGSVCVSCSSGQCQVKGFELPQKTTFTDEWFAGVGDPDFIVYYESFPWGIEYDWQPSGFSFVRDVVILGSVANTIVPVGQLFGKGIRQVVNAYRLSRTQNLEFKEALRQFAERQGLPTITDDVLEEFANLYQKQSYRRLIQTQFLYENLLGALPAAQASRIDDFRRALFNKIMDLERRGQPIDPSAIVNQLKDETHQRRAYVKWQQRGSPEDFSRSTQDWAQAEQELRSEGNLLFNDDALPILRQKTPEALQPFSAAIEQGIIRKAKIRDYFERFLLKKEGSRIVLNPNEFQKLFSRNAGSYFNTLNNEQKQTFLRKSLEYMDDVLADQRGVAGLNWQSILGTNDPAIIAQLQNEFNNLITQPNIAALFTGHGLETLQILRAGDRLVRSIPIIGRRTSDVGRIFIIPAGAALGAAEFVWDSRAARYTAAFAIGSILAQRDLMENKYTPKGISTLAVTRPFEDQERARTYTLQAPGIDTTYLNLEMDTGDNSRFFLVSPCKADITLRKTRAKCAIQAGDYLLQTNQPIENEFSEIEEAQVTNINWFRGDGRSAFLTPAEQQDAVDACLSYPIRYQNCFNQLFKQSQSQQEPFAQAILESVKKAIRFMEAYSVSNLFTQDRDISAQGLQPIGSDPNFRYFAFFRDAALRESSFQIVPTDTFQRYKDGSLSGENFQKEVLDHFKSILYQGDLSSISNQLQAIRSMKQEHDTNGGYEPIFMQGGVLWNLAADSYFNYNTLQAQPQTVVKTCSNFEPVTYTSHVIENQNYQSGFAHIDAVTIAADLDLSYGSNYCYLGPRTTSAILSWSFTGVAVGIDLATATATSPVGAIVIAPITGGAAAYLSHLVTPAWPNRE